MRGDGAFLEMLREAVATLRALDVPLEETLDYEVSIESRPPPVAHALGVLEGVGVTLGLTARELLDAFDLLPAPRPAPRRRPATRRGASRS